MLLAAGEQAMAERRGGGGGEQAPPGCGCLIRRPMRGWRVGPRRNGASGRRGPRCQLRHTWSELGRKVLEIGLDQTEDRAAQVRLMDFGIKSEHKAQKCQGKNEEEGENGETGWVQNARFTR